MLKRALAGLTAIVMACSSGCYLSSRSVNDGLDINSPSGADNGYENNNISLTEDVLHQAERSVELMTVSAVYLFTDSHGNERVGTLTSGGSATVLDKNSAITNHHVIDMPDTVNSAYLDLDPVLSESLNYFSDPELMQLIIGGGYEAQRIGDPDITLAGIRGIKVVCPDYSEEEEPGPPYEGPDYALLDIPFGNHHLFPLSENQNVFVGDSDLLRSGDFLYVVGFPFGLGRITSEGIVSATDGYAEGRELRDFNFLFDNAISPGNSGGAAFAVYEGNLYYIGIPTAYYRDGQNLNLAVSINSILEDIQDNHNIPLEISSVSVPQIDFNNDYLYEYLIFEE